MNKPTILITGATGATGAPSVEMLLEKGYQVRALVHKNDERSERLKKLGAKIIVGDMRSMEDVRAAWDGATRGYFCYPLSPDLLDVAVMFAQGAKEQNADVIVNMSQKQAAKGVKSPATIRHWLSEQLFEWSGVPTVNLRPTFFSEWFLYIASQIKQSKLEMSFSKDSQHAPVAAEDLARVIVNILIAPEKHIGKAYQLFGPELLTYTQIGEIIGQTLGRDITYQQVDIQTMADWIGWGGYDHFKNHVRSVEGDHVFGGENDHIEKIGGQKPMSLAAFIDKNRAAFAV